MIVLEDIAREVLRILVAHGHNPVGSIAINLNVPKRDFDHMLVGNADSVHRFETDTYGELRDEGELGDISWNCTLSYSLYSGSYVRMPAVKDRQLKAIIQDLATSFKTTNVSVSAYQVDWVLEAADFDDKFTGDPNLLADMGRGIQASEPVEGMYCSIQIMRPIQLDS